MSEVKLKYADQPRPVVGFEILSECGNRLEAHITPDMPHQMRMEISGCAHIYLYASEARDIAVALLQVADNMRHR